MASMTLMAPKNCHLHQWTANVSNGAIDDDDIIDTMLLAFIWHCGRHIAMKYYWLVIVSPADI